VSEDPPEFRFKIQIWNLMQSGKNDKKALNVVHSGGLELRFEVLHGSQRRKILHFLIRSKIGYEGNTNTCATVS
jgi:hypothetical protein